MILYYCLKIFIYLSHIVCAAGVALLEDVGAEHGGQRTGVPVLLLEGGHAGQEAAQEAQEAVVQLGKLLQEVLEVSTQLLVTAIIWGISTGEKVTIHSQTGLRNHKKTKTKQKTPGLNCCSKFDKKNLLFSTLCEVR